MILLLLLTASMAASPAESRLEDLVREHVAEAMEAADDDVEVLSLGLRGVPSCLEEAKVVLSSRPVERFSGHATIVMEAELDGHRCIRTRFRPRLRVWGERPVAIRDHEPGDVVEWELARVELGESTLDMADLEAGEGWLARGTVRQGTPLASSNVRPMPAAREGSPVRIVAGGGTLRVEATGRLLSDAALDEVVRVMNLATRQSQEGVLVGPGCVVLSGPAPLSKEVCE